jgi:hypothetical protein
MSVLLTLTPALAAVAFRFDTRSATDDYSPAFEF